MLSESPAPVVLLRRLVLRVITLAVPLCTACSGCATATTTARQPEPLATVHVVTAQQSAAVLRRVERSYLRLRIEPTEAALKRAAQGAGGSAPRAPVAPPHAKAAAAARAALQSASQAYRELRFDLAIAQLEDAQAALIPLARAPGEVRLVAELALLRGLSHLAQRRQQQAGEAIALALALGARPATGAFAPETERFIESVRQQRARQAAGGLTVVTEPAGTQVWVDGQRRGAAPATVELAPGLHHVRVAHLGYRSRAWLVRVAPGRIERTHLALQPLAGPELAAQLLQHHGTPTALPETPDVLRRAIDADAWLHLQRDEQGIRATAHWLRGEQPAAALRCTGRDEALVADCLARGLYRLQTGHERGTPATARPPLYRRWWFWTAVGVAAAAGAGTGIYFAAQPTGTDVDVVVR